MLRFALLIGALACGCGRVAFESTADAAATTGDTVAASLCPIDGTTIFCDDFESPSFSKWTTAMSVTHVASPVRTGTGAMRASVPSASIESWVYAQLPQLAALPSFSLRFWIYVETDASVVQVNWLTFASGMNGQELTVLGFTDEIHVWRETSSSVGYVGPIIQRARWTCVELDAAVDDASGSLELRVDGVRVLSDSAVDTRVDGDYRELTFGLPYSNFAGQGAITVYYDDVHLGTQAVGCN